MPNLTATATCIAFNGEKSWDRPQGFAFEVGGFPDRDAAAAFVAQFPKGARFRIAADAEPGTFRAVADASLVPNGTNGDINEAGLKRYVSVLRVAERVGVTVDWVARYGNSYPTRAAFETAAGL